MQKQFSFETTIVGENDPLAMKNDTSESKSVSSNDDEERYVISFEG